MTTKRLVRLAGLGKCEHCGTLITMEDLPAEAIDANWKCSRCKKVLTGKSFGYDKKSKKVRWIGPKGKWVREEPKKDFELGNWSVLTGRMPLI